MCLCRYAEVIITEKSLGVPWIHTLISNILEVQASVEALCVCVCYVSSFQQMTILIRK